MAGKPLKELQKQVFAVYAKVRATRQEMGDIDALETWSEDWKEFDKMYETLNNMEVNLEQTLSQLPES